MIASGTDLVAPTAEELHARYADYRRRHARALVGMLPREAVRPLYRRARTLVDSPRCDHECEDNPLARLSRFCETLLPLPPFEVWLEDLRRSPEAHLGDLDLAEAPTPAAPATLVARRFAHGGDAWVARLRAFRDREAWRGFIAFEDGVTGTVHRTSLIFRERSPFDLRERFLGFERATLEAFLRSSLP